MYQNTTDATNGEAQMGRIREAWKTEIQQLNDQKNNLIDEKNIEQRELVSLSQDIYGTPHIHQLSVWKSIIWFLALATVALLEYPLNGAAFEVFDRSVVETKILAITFGIIIAMFAHLSGFSIKRFVVLKKQYHFLIAGIVALVSAVVCLYIASTLRYDYMKEMNQQPMPVLKQCVFSSLIFFAGAIYSFFHASEVKNLTSERSYKQKLKLLKRHEGDIGAIEMQITQTNEKYNKKINDLEQVLKFERTK